jgi:hypothetical protein
MVNAPYVMLVHAVLGRVAQICVMNRVTFTTPTNESIPVPVTFGGLVFARTGIGKDETIKALQSSKDEAIKEKGLLSSNYDGYITLLKSNLAVKNAIIYD